MNKFLLCVVCIFLSVCFSAPLNLFASPNDTVYITKSGKKYHYSTCRTLARSRNVYRISLSEAKQRGYTVCKVCRPPRASNDKNFITSYAYKVMCINFLYGEITLTYKN